MPSAIRELVRKSRTYRRFREDLPISKETILDLIDITRFCPSASNAQPLKFFVSCDPATNRTIMQYHGWAGHLKDWQGPKEGERPTAYIAVLLDTSISKNPFCDHGIIAQTILLAAAEQGLGGCIIASFNGEKLQATLGIDKKYEILLLIALGTPGETVVLEEVGPSGDTKYWRDEKSVHHVPKRRLEDFVLKVVGG